MRINREKIQRMIDAQGGSSGGGGGGGNEPSEDALFSFYVQNGENGTPVLKRSFIKSEINGILEKGVFPYLYYKNEAWAAIVATEVLTLDSIFTESGISSEWKSGSYLKFTCKDGEYGKSYPSYDDIQAASYYFDADGVAEIVPAGIAISWEDATVGSTGAISELTADNISAIAASAKDTGSYRLVFGTTEALFNSANAGGNAPAGARSPSGVVSMTLVYNSSSVPKGSVGVEHTPEKDNSNTDSSADTPAVTETVKVEAKADANGVATATVEAKAVTEAVAKLAESKAESIVIAPEVTGEAKEVKVELPKASVSEIANSTDAALVIETDKGSVEVPNEVLKEIAEKAGGANVEISVADKSVEDAGVKEAIAETVGEASTENAAVAEITVSSGEKKITSFGGKSINASVSVDGKKNFAPGKKYLTLVISSNGKRELLAGKCVADASGKLSVGVKVKHLSIDGRVDEFHVDALLLAGAQEHVEDALALVEGDLNGAQDPSVLRHEFLFLRIEPAHVIQDRRAGDRDRTGVLYVADLDVLRLHGDRSAFRYCAGHIAIQPGLGIQLHPLRGGILRVSLFTCLISCEGGGVGQLVLHGHDALRSAWALIQSRGGRFRGRRFCYLPALQTRRVPAVPKGKGQNRDQAHRHDDLPFVFFPEHRATLSGASRQLPQRGSQVFESAILPPPLGEVSPQATERTYSRFAFSSMLYSICAISQRLMATVGWMFSAEASRMPLS